MTKSKIFLYILLSFLMGVMLASFLVLPYQDGNVLKFISGFAAILGISLILLSRLNLNSRINLGFIGVFILLFAFGVFWYQRNVDLNMMERSGLMNEIMAGGKTRGIIIDEPEFKNDRAKYIIGICRQIQYRQSDNRLISDISQCEKNDFKILIQTSKYPQYKYGDEISIKGKIKEPENFTPTPNKISADALSSQNTKIDFLGEYWNKFLVWGFDEKFDYKSYLAKDDIYLTVYNPQIEFLAQDKGNKIYAALYKFKNELENIFRENLSEPHASFLAGITLGSKSGIPEDVYEKFKATGTAHIVALSGFNISVIAWAIMGALMFFMISRNLSFWISFFVIVIFVLMTGASPSVVRAAVMGILILIARQQGRLYTAKNALVFAGAVMIFLNPKILRFDAGFQLSFLATLGLIILSPKLEEKLKNIPKLFGTKEAFIATLSAQIFVLPLLVYQFGNFSPVGILVNVLVLPAVPIAMFLGFAGVFTGFIFAPLSKIFLWPAWLFLSWILGVVNWF